MAKKQTINTDSFLGTGWGFPPTFHREKKGVVMLSDVPDINSSLHILMSTRIRERLMQPKYGCNLDQFLFEPITLSLLTYMRSLIKDAILYFEPRIKLIDLDLVSDDLNGKVEIDITYEVLGTNSRFNYVYPFYLNEGENIEQ